MQPVITSAREEKVNELGYRFIKANKDFEFKRITQVDLAHEIQGLNNEGKILAIDPNEILSNAMANKDAYKKQLASVNPGIPY